jgi:hypothetical protein
MLMLLRAEQSACLICLDLALESESCFQEKVELSNLVKKIQEISKMLALPVSDDNRDSFVAELQVSLREHRKNNKTKQKIVVLL